MDGYVRVSKLNGRGGESFISPDAQRERIEQAAKAAAVTVAEWHTDLDESGTHDPTRIAR
jgi:DNA invertase Pin-like site-specific DNA recombinase